MLQIEEVPKISPSLASGVLCPSPELTHMYGLGLRARAMEQEYGEPLATRRLSAVASQRGQKRQDCAPHSLNPGLGGTVEESSSFQHPHRLIHSRKRHASVRISPSS